MFLFLKKRVKLTGALALIFLAGCQPQSETIEGQVFLVNDEGLSVPLPLIEVQIYSQKRVQDHIVRREREWAESKDRLSGEIEGMQENLTNVRAMYQELQAEQAGLNERIRREGEQIERRFIEQTNPLQILYESNVELIERMEIGPRLPQGIPSPAEYELFEQTMARWQEKTTAERQVWKRELEEENVQLRLIMAERLEERDNQLRRLREREQNTAQALRQLSRQLAELEKEVREAEKIVGQAVPQAGLLDGLSQPERIVHTDASGYFSITLSDLRDRALVARVNRRLQGETVAHTWLLWVNPRQKGGERILFSNHNSMEATAESGDGQENEISGE